MDDETFSVKTTEYVKQITTGTSDHFFHFKLVDCEQGAHCLISISSEMKLSNLSARMI